MSEVKTVLPVVTCENGVAQGFEDLRAMLRDVQVVAIEDKIDAQQMAALKKDMKSVSDNIKKSTKQAVKEYENQLHEQNGTLFAIQDTADSIIADITENQNVYNTGRIKELEVVLQKEVDERNANYQLKVPLTIKADWLKMSNFTATGKPTSALTKLLNLEFIKAKSEENKVPEITEDERFKRALKYQFAKVWEQIEDDSIYSGADIKNLLKPIASEFG